MPETKTTAYDDLIAAGIEVESHESDLYCEDTVAVVKILDKHGCTYSPFYSSADGKMWLEAPFQFMPYWRNRVKVSQ